MIRDKMVKICYSQYLKEYLVAQGSLYLNITIKIARTNENAIKKTKNSSSNCLGQKDHPINIDNALWWETKLTCYRYGDPCHESNDIPTVNCKYTRVCHSKSRSEKSKKQRWRWSKESPCHKFKYAWKVAWWRNRHRRRKCWACSFYE